MKQAARDLERLPDRSRDQVEEAIEEIERLAQTDNGDVKMLAGEGVNSGCVWETGEFASSMRSRTSSGFCIFGIAATRTVEAAVCKCERGYERTRRFSGWKLFSPVNLRWFGPLAHGETGWKSVSWGANIFPS